MRHWFKWLLAIVVTVELLTVGFVGHKAYQQWLIRQSVLGAETIIPVNQDMLIFPSNTRYKNFYEPEPNKVRIEPALWLSEEVSYTINSDSLNDTHEYSIEKAPGTFRVLTLGDSFTYGLNVNTQDNWPSKLEILMSTLCERNKTEVINLGVSGYDIVFAAYRYELRGKKYNPDLVIWVLNDHNFFQMPELFKKRSNELWKELTQQDLEESIRDGNYAPHWRRSRKEVEKLYDKAQIIEQENAALYEFARLYSGPLVLVSNNVTPRYMALLKLFVRFRTDPTYLVNKSLQVHEVPERMFPDRHPNELGHSYIAQAIYEYLKEQGVISCH